ncbi:MAG: hypothetical protein ACREDV_02320, partial [Methylocella sp.]
MPRECFSPASWRRKPIEQAPDFADQAELAEGERQLARFAASPGACSPTPARPALKSSGTLRGALLAATVLCGIVASFPDIAHAHHPASNPTGHKEAPVELIPGPEEPSITSIIPALGDLKKGLLDRGINFQLSYIQDTFGNPVGGVRQGATYGSVLYMA